MGSIKKGKAADSFIMSENLFTLVSTKKSSITRSINDYTYPIYLGFTANIMIRLNLLTLIVKTLYIIKLISDV